MEGPAIPQRTDGDLPTLAFVYEHFLADDRLERFMIGTLAMSVCCTRFITILHVLFQ